MKKSSVTHTISKDMWNVDIDTARYKIMVPRYVEKLLFKGRIWTMTYVFSKHCLRSSRRKKLLMWVWGYTCSFTLMGIRDLWTVLQSNKRFNDRMIVYVGFKNYVCGLCGEDFARWHCPKYHILIHSGDKNYACEICGKTFCQKGRLLKHGYIHTEGNIQ